MKTEKKQLIELPSFELNSHGIPEDNAIRAYDTDGIVCLRKVFEPSWIEMLEEGMEIAINKGADRESVFRITESEESGIFFYDTFMWKHIDHFRKFVFESPVADIEMNIMRSTNLLFYFDFMLVKEPGTSAKTPWHYDEAYWPVAGSKICNFWVTLDEIPKETALRFVRGSHLWEEPFRAVHFDPTTNYANLPDNPEPPEWEFEPGEHEIVYAPLSPGDCLIFNRRTMHSAPGNSLKSTRRRALATHWFGDDVTYNNKPQETDPPYRGEGLVHGGSMECESFPKVR